MPRSARSATSEAEGGTYVVLVDRLRQEVFAEDDKVRKEPVDEFVYDKGEDIELDAQEAARHIAGGAVAKEGTLQARVARGEVPAEFVPNPSLTDEQLRVQLAAIEQVLAERQENISYDVSAEGGVDPTDPEAVKSATRPSSRSESTQNAKGDSATKGQASENAGEGQSGRAKSGGGAGERSNTKKS